jgi:arabinofuranosyltransferase
MAAERTRHGKLLHCVSRIGSANFPSAVPRVDGAQVAAGVVLLTAAAGLYWGWQLHWFLTDDAYIAFRFISNRHAGYGYTWNPPPFLPVEGYTSFGWILLLDAIWSVFGLEPPDVANNVALACALGTLALTSWACHRMCQLRGVSRATAVWATAAVLFATITNRTFLAWASSGLETALFNLLLQSWLLAGLLGAVDLRPRTLALLCGLASAIELTRPDGLVPISASATLVVVCALLGVVRVRTAVACAAPLSLTAAHLLYRRSFYGEWLPNTYYAKVVAPWPEAGARYLAAFVLEYAYYLALPLILAGGFVWLRASLRRLAAVGGEARRTEAARTLVRLGVLGAVLAMLGFDVLIAGGDHFEYRALSFLCPLLPLGFLYGCLALRIRAHVSALALLGWSAVSAVLPWTAYQQTNAQYAWPTEPLVIPTAPDAPLLLRPVARAFDALQDWLIPHGIGVRHYEHRAFWLHQLRNFPTRERGKALCAAADHPVMPIATIGVSGWVLPGCAVIDLRGLADYVIARTPGKLGYLGHDRKPPLDYLQAFEPNVFVRGNGEVRIYPRPRPLTDERIREIERDYRAKVAEQNATAK